ncbi:MAG TPA: dTDP-4-dehydrorhamnose 3,5-epimerase family protein [Patescibacteria group bacterium]|nr:dTDP-4-dehydrorhamnose 3,5-epimerase family protein [Patescibacteria group bacterium]
MVSPNLYEPKPELEIKDGVFKTVIDGLFYLAPNFFPDERGFFAELGHTYKIEDIIGTPFKVAQINHSRSTENVVRGLHAEGWNKLVVVTAGVAFSALVDVRPDSPTFSKVVTTMMGPDDGGLKGAWFITQGIANSVCTVKAPVDYLYFVDKLYKDRDLSGDQAISLFDPDLKIDWPTPKEKMIISERDRNSVTLREKFPDKFKA